jgi:O-antigen ligase
LLFFLAAGGLSVLGSAKHSTSALEFLRIGSAVTMLLVLERVMINRAVVKRVIAACIAASLVPGLVAVTQLASGGGLFTSGGYSRIRGTFVHPNPYAIFLSFTLIMSVAMFSEVHGRLRVWLALLTLGNGVALMLTYTRTGWVAAVAGIFVYCWLNKKLKYFFLAALVGVVILSPVIIGRLQNLGRLQRANGTAGNSLIWRFGYWTQILPLANHNPISGVGLKMVQFNAIEQKEPHNDFIRAYVETGLVGFIAYLTVQVAMWRTALHGLRATKFRGGFDRAVATGFMGAVVAFTLVSIVSNVISSSVLLWYLFAFAAAAGAVTHLPVEEQSAADGADSVLTLDEIAGASGEL